MGQEWEEPREKAMTRPGKPRIGQMKATSKMANIMNYEEMKTELRGLEKRTGTW